MNPVQDGGASAVLNGAALLLADGGQHIVRSKRQFSVWLPIALAFAGAVTLTGFGVGVIVSSVGAAFFAVFVFALVMIPGAIVGGIAIGATRVADRVARTLPAERRVSVAVLHASAAGLAAGISTWFYATLTQGSDPAPIAPALFVAVVAAIFAGRESATQGWIGQQIQRGSEDR